MRHRLASLDVCKITMTCFLKTKLNQIEQPTKHYFITNFSNSSLSSNINNLRNELQQEKKNYFIRFNFFLLPLLMLLLLLLLPTTSPSCSFVAANSFSVQSFSLPAVPFCMRIDCQMCSVISVIDFLKNVLLLLLDFSSSLFCGVLYLICYRFFVAFESLSGFMSIPMKPLALAV